MAKKLPEPIFVGLDIGTTKVLVIVAEFNATGQMKIIGLGHHRSKGMKKGVISDIESTVESIQRAVEEASLMANCDISSAYVGIAGAHIHSINSHGVAAIKNGEVDALDVRHVLEAARAMAVPSDHSILHVLPQDFTIDGQQGILDPIGMSGVRMEAGVHVVTGSSSAAQNIMKCIRRCGLEANALVLEQIASSESVLSNDEKDLGVCMVDIGGGTTDIAVYHDGFIKHTAVIPIAGDHVTNDIAMAFNTPKAVAEEIKKRFGNSLVQLVDKDQEIEIASIGGRPPKKLKRWALAEVIEPRVDELMVMIQSELDRTGFLNLVGSGIVLTGGTSGLDGIVELAEEIFHLPVRRGIPDYQGNLEQSIRNPIFSTGIGLIKYGYARQNTKNLILKEYTTEQKTKKSITGWVKSIFA
ncbi:MAG: cell division protein FtsA [Gammaproteobacteria bacterium]|nr:cell division protein FtsA [Gammaproteobacteria bacterium]MCY4218144.1 cell division protein FtsA [Gammaproteobacteria bacterium]MCY4275590.1 cell division protein FtsA [Gammaproteobacteria bacterium]